MGSELIQSWTAVVESIKDGVVTCRLYDLTDTTDSSIEECDLSLAVVEQSLDCIVMEGTLFEIDVKLENGEPSLNISKKHTYPNILSEEILEQIKDKYSDILWH